MALQITKKIKLNDSTPHIIKYMGSKRSIMEFVISGINQVYTGGTVCDLFAGSCALSGVLRNQVPVLSNDIQQYSATLAHTYLGDYKWEDHPNILEEIIKVASNRAYNFMNQFSDLSFNYKQEFSLEQFNELEMAQQKLIDYSFPEDTYHLFAKFYSGTYWSYEQCVWIDAIKSVADDYEGQDIYYVIMSSLMFAMSYNSQSTGHYAQYRDATTLSSMTDILIYRQKEILPYFRRKFEELHTVLGRNNFSNQVESLDYLDCLDLIKPGTTVYADPPYCFVHYSRFYHALETLVRYDYPDVKHKGRYRTDRHQSPFCIKTKVEDAFRQMFIKIRDKQSNLVLSYSNTGMISLDQLTHIANKIFSSEHFEIIVDTQDYSHSTMGRKEDKSRDVQECLLLVRKL